ncbi:PAS domain-containing methyl-accepting chemotaxis protein [Burkholderia mayonis]|uniref:Chemotaxis protein n=1 Tax=Burkholderia mayonis TaxID=1385591 RepID=A0A1B4G5I3_9BURK|nr:PAS domain-containing methyl-accepting chemotaxis protein [Burkholderia mayonis]AOJ11188.1 chemotaxis protein [Burkholderia mayonis]KVE46162.1 chemotaxis protein [Burkholderia mayonis]
MRANLPVTQREYDFPDDATLMSTTDPQSYVTYANAAFVEVSGFEPSEIIGEPHNLVRHPDMPAEAFADMWTTLKAGRSWTALVKNRRKNGDHYWVRANATPVIRSGQLVGYMSVRTKPSRDEIAQAELLYRDLREGRARGRKFHQGLIVRTGLLGWASLLQTMSVRWRVRAALLALLACSAWGAFLFGLRGLMLDGFAGAEAVLLLLAELWLAAQITAPLQRVLKQSLAVAAGQAGENMHLNRVDEIGMILRAVNQAGLNLRSLVDDVSEQLSGLQSASGNIIAGNDDLSRRSEQAAASLEETAASMEQMTATVRNNAETAMQASQLAGSTSDAATKGDAVVGKVVETMGEISASSRKISEIIGVIDGIAFQTNILALNAAVEAARAGEQGRGFAVVAGEVRTLAQRSANAAKEIAGLIHDSVQKTTAGSALVNQAGEAMNDIRSQVARVADLIGEISSATREQSDGIGQVNVAVTQLDQMTQQNATLVQESATTADDLKNRSQRLVDAVAVFRSNASATTRPRDARPARAANASAAVRAPAKPGRRATRAMAAPSFANASASALPAPAPASVATVAETDWQTF